MAMTFDYAFLAAALTVSLVCPGAIERDLPLGSDLRGLVQLASGDDCIRECQQRFRDRIEICNDLFNSPGSPYYRDTVWHRRCLEEARTEFDNCRSTC